MILDDSSLSTPFALAWTHIIRFVNQVAQAKLLNAEERLKLQGIRDAMSAEVTVSPSQSHDSDRLDKVVR